MTCIIMLLIMYSDRVVVSALESEHDASVVSSPRSRHPHLTVVPHPADVVTQRGVLGDLVEAGRNRHVDHLTRLQCPQCNGGNKLGGSIYTCWEK